MLLYNNKKSFFIMYCMHAVPYFRLAVLSAVWILSLRRKCAVSNQSCISLMFKLIIEDVSMVKLDIKLHPEALFVLRRLSAWVFGPGRHYVWYYSYYDTMATCMCDMSFTLYYLQDDSWRCCSVLLTLFFVTPALAS